MFTHPHPDQADRQSYRARRSAPDHLPAFPHAIRIRPESGRVLWREPDGTLLEWDDHDGALEMYGVHGWHLGEYDPVTGGNLKVAEPGRRLRA